MYTVGCWDISTRVSRDDETGGVCWYTIDEPAWHSGLRCYGNNIRPFHQSAGWEDRVVIVNSFWMWTLLVLPLSISRCCVANDEIRNLPFIYYFFFFLTGNLSIKVDWNDSHCPYKSVNLFGLQDRNRGHRWSGCTGSHLLRWSCSCVFIICFWIKHLFDVSIQLFFCSLYLFLRRTPMFMAKTYASIKRT